MTVVQQETERLVHVETNDALLEGNLTVPDGATGIVLFAHGSGSSRHSPRNRFVARVLNQGGLATLLFDLLTNEEEDVDRVTRHLRFDIDLLADRLAGATDWLLRQPETQALHIGYFGSSTGAAAALIAATQHPDTVRAVVSRGGRPDLAKRALADVEAPTLLIVGGNDRPVIDLNAQTLEMLQTKAELQLVPGAGHLFEGPGHLEMVAGLARDWFREHLRSST